MEEVKCKLTEFSPGAGCGCKISPKVLDKILKTSDENNCNNDSTIFFKDLIVGHETKDDAAVYRFDEQYSVISTTDFFTPIVDDPKSFGMIAATNAISDVFAMGGTPLMAIAILGWPVKKLSVEAAKSVIDGAREICKRANIPLAGGHSIDIDVPIFGLAVTGKIKTNNVKKNSSARCTDKIYLTKPLGIGIMSTAEKKGILENQDRQNIVNWMTTLNSIGAIYGELDYVHGVTDVTGFGLLGHLLEMCEGANLVAEICCSKLPLIKNLDKYVAAQSFPGGIKRNLDSYGEKVHFVGESFSDGKDLLDWQNILADPQTSGGLLIAVDKKFEKEFLNISQQHRQQVYEIGSFFYEEEIIKNNSWIRVEK